MSDTKHNPLGIDFAQIDAVAEERKQLLQSITVLIEHQSRGAIEGLSRGLNFLLQMQKLVEELDDVGRAALPRDVRDTLLGGGDLITRLEQYLVAPEPPFFFLGSLLNYLKYAAPEAK